MYKYLIWVGTAFLATASLFLLVKTDRVLNTAITTNTVSFSGEGKVLAKPDIAKVQLSIVTDALTSKTAQNENSKKSKAVTDYLQKQGLGDKDIKTTGYNIYPQYKYSQYGGNPQITGYQVNQTIEIRIRNLEQVSSILDGVVTAGANQINQLNFTIDKPEKLRAEARQEAIKNAKNKADELEDQLNIKLGRITNFSENTGGFPPPIFLEAKDISNGLGGGGPTVPTGENEIIVSVVLTYQIK